MKRATGWCAVTATILSAIHVSSALSQACCVQPSHESTTASAYLFNITRFKQRVSDDLHSDYDGVSVREGDGNGGTSFDGCWFPGSERTKFEVVSGGRWDVGEAEPNESQVWGYDYLSWPIASVNYYRDERPSRGLFMPCSTRLIQSMARLCVITWEPPYTQNNVLTLYIDTTTVTNCRSDISNSDCLTQGF